MFKCGLQSSPAYINYTISCALQSSEFGKRIIYYRKMQTRTLRIRKQIFTNDDVMKYVIGALQ